MERKMIGTDSEEYKINISKINMRYMIVEISNLKH